MSRPLVRVTDGKARVTLPRSFANATLVMEVRGENEVVLRRAEVVPVGGLVSVRFAPADWARFLEVLDAPPAPNAELRALMRRRWVPGEPFGAEG